MCKAEKVGEAKQSIKYSIGDARTPQPWEIVLNTMRSRSTETVQRPGILSEQHQLYKGPNIVLSGQNNFYEKENVCKDKV